MTTQKPGPHTNFLEISGEPAERGHKYGNLAQKEIKKAISFFHNFNQRNGFSIKETRDIANKFLPYITKYSPEIEAELKAIATGAQVNYHDILMISLNEERNIFNNKGNCSSFAATGNSTYQNKAVIGQTWDNFLEWEDNFNDFLLIRRATQGSDIISYTYPGLLAAAGLNSAGIAICWNSVPRLKIKKGVPTYIIIEEILRQKTIGDALTAVMRANRAGCFSLFLSDGDEIYHIEATPNDIEINYSADFLSHGNHYLTPRFARQEPEPENLEKYRRKASSIIRDNRMNKFLKENSGRISMATAQRFLKDHLNYPHSICRHSDKRSKYSDKFLTRAAWIIEPARKELWYAGGPPCENQFIRYKL